MEYTNYLLRLPSKVNRAIKQMARDNYRSFNRQLNEMLIAQIPAKYLGEQTEQGAGHDVERA